MEQILGRERGILQFHVPNEISYEMRFLSTREMYSTWGQTKYLQRAMRLASGKQEKYCVGTLD